MITRCSSGKDSLFKLAWNKYEAAKFFSQSRVVLSNNRSEPESTIVRIWHLLLHAITFHCKHVIVEAISVLVVSRTSTSTPVTQATRSSDVGITFVKKGKMLKRRTYSDRWKFHSSRVLLLVVNRRPSLTGTRNVNCNPSLFLWVHHLTHPKP